MLIYSTIALTVTTVNRGSVFAVIVTVLETGFLSIDFELGLNPTFITSLFPG
jgi:hypothetical protein